MLKAKADTIEKPGVELDRTPKLAWHKLAQSPAVTS
jgi:hypothetical protein